MTRIRTINNEIDIKSFSQNFIVVSVLLDDQYRTDRCDSCGWGAWPDSSDITGMVQKWGPMTTIGAYRYEDRMDAVEDVETFMSRQGFTKVDKDDYENEEDMYDAPEYDPEYMEVMDYLPIKLNHRPADQFTMWDGYAFEAERAPRFGIHVALVRFGDQA